MAAFCILNHGPFLNVPEHWSLYDTDTPLTAHCTLSQDGLPLLTIDNESTPGRDKPVWRPCAALPTPW